MSSRTHRIESSAVGLDGDGWLRRCDFADAIHRIDRWHRDSGLIESGASMWLAFSAALGVRDSCVGGKAPPCTRSPGALLRLGYGNKRTIMRAVHSSTVLPICQCDTGPTLGTQTQPQRSDCNNIPRHRAKGEEANRGGSECNERRDASQQRDTRQQRQHHKERVKRQGRRPELENERRPALRRRPKRIVCATRQPARRAAPMSRSPPPRARPPRMETSPRTPTTPAMSTAATLRGGLPRVHLHDRKKWGPPHRCAIHLAAVVGAAGSATTLPAACALMSATAVGGRTTNTFASINTGVGAALETSATSATSVVAVAAVVPGCLPPQR